MKRIRFFFSLQEINIAKSHPCSGQNYFIHFSPNRPLFEEPTGTTNPNISECKVLFTPLLHQHISKHDMDHFYCFIHLCNLILCHMRPRKAVRSVSYLPTYGISNKMFKNFKLVAKFWNSADSSLGSFLSVKVVVHTVVWWYLSTLVRKY